MDHTSRGLGNYSIPCKVQLAQCRIAMTRLKMDYKTLTGEVEDLREELAFARVESTSKKQRLRKQANGKHARGRLLNFVKSIASHKAVECKVETFYIDSTAFRDAYRTQTHERRM